MSQNRSNELIRLTWPFSTGRQANPEELIVALWVSVLAISVMVLVVTHQSLILAGLCAGLCIVPLMRFVRLKRIREASSHLSSVRFLRFDTLLNMYRGPGHSQKLYIGHGHIWSAIDADVADKITTSIYRHIMTAHHKLTRREERMHNEIEADGASRLEAGQPTSGRRSEGAVWMRMLAPMKPLYIPERWLDGHVLITGTTGSGKTTMMNLLNAQIIYSGQALFVVDPKSDPGLKNGLISALRAMGQEHRFRYFSLSEPESSCRLNLLANASSDTDIADRIVSMMPTTEDNTFTAYCHKAVLTVVSNMRLAHIEPTLKGLNECLNRPGALYSKSMEAWLSQRWPEYLSYLDKYLRGAPRDDDTAIANAFHTFYSSEVAQRYPNSELFDMGQQAVHDREHFSKMITTLAPLMTQLTTGNIGRLLTPDIHDVDDKREILDLDTAVKKKYVVYLRTSGIGQRTISTRVGAAFAAGMAAVASQRYESVSSAAELENLDPVAIMLDEAVELLNDTVIRLLNKSRGAAYRMILATQTIADPQAVLGSEARANQTLGNINTKIFLRSSDPITMKYIKSILPQTKRTSVTTSRSQQKRGGPDGNSQSQSRSLKVEYTPFIPDSMLPTLAPLDYLAYQKSGELYYGTIPIVSD